VNSVSWTLGCLLRTDDTGIASTIMNGLEFGWASFGPAVVF